MKFNVKIFLIVFLITTIFLGCATISHNQNWLIGEWGLAYDPDGDEKDYITFLADGSFVTRSPGNQSFTGQYTVKEDELIFEFEVQGKPIKMVMIISDDKMKLSNESGAYYTKEH